MEAAAREVAWSVRLLAGALVPCVGLLCCLTGLLVLRRRRRPARPSRPSVGLPWPAPVAASSAGRAPAPPRFRRPPEPPRLPSDASDASSASDLHRPPFPVPPNSPAGSWAAAGISDGTYGRQPPSTQRKGPRCRPAFPARLHPSPFEYCSSIRRGDKRTQLSSTSLTASQGPGLDSDFGASAGVSLRILSSDSEESPPAPLLHPQESGRFEWDYYDPSYKKSPPLQRHLPCICSKQYWL